jgi:hypothetical protein
VRGSPRASTWTGTGARRIDLTSPDQNFGFFGESLAWLAPARLQRQRRCGSIGGDTRTIVSAE